MQTIGDVLIRDGLITKAQLAEALRLQEAKDGQVDQMLVKLGVITREQAQAAWIQSYVTMPLEEAIDRSCANQFTNDPQRTITYERLLRKHTVSEDVLNDSKVAGQEANVEGRAVLSYLGRSSLPLDFTIELDCCFAVLDDPSEVMVRRWVPLISKQAAQGSDAA